MGLIRFTESFTPSLEVHNKYVSSRKLTEDEVRNLQTGSRLNEATKLFMENNPVARLSEKTVFKMPISRYDEENANGRIYTKKLWENVINNQKEVWMGGLGLADHPEGDKEGSFKEASVVYLGLSLGESENPGERLVFAECIFVGKYGKLAEEILEAGGRVGFSSSGFGELEESNKKVVRPDTYMLERVADLVLNPSQNVFGTKNDAVLNRESTTNNKSESTKSLQEETQTMIKESSTSTGKFSKLEERKFRKDVTQFLAEAVNVINPSDRLSQLEEIQGYFSEGIATDLLDEVSKKILETKEEIRTSIEEFSKLKETFDVSSTEAMKEGVKHLAVDNQYFEKTADEWKNIAKALQETNKKLNASLSIRPTAEAHREALIAIKSLKEACEVKDAEAEEDEKEFEEALNKQKSINQNLIKELSESQTALSKAVVLVEKYKMHTQALKEEIATFKNKEKMLEASAIKAQNDQMTIDFSPKSVSPKMFEGYNQSSEVREYYEDLVERHGADITPFEEKICAHKTLKEAMSTYTKILAGMGRNQTTKVSEALDGETRKRIIEAQTGKVLKTGITSIEKRIPNGWI